MKFTFKIWIYIIFVILALISIFSFPPMFLEKGVMIKSVERNSIAFDSGLRKGMIIKEINNQQIANLGDYANALSIFTNNSVKLDIKVKTGAGFGSKNIVITNMFPPETANQVIVGSIPKTRLATGLDIQGGARALIGSDQPLTESQLDDLIAISQQRLNVYGLSDVKVTKVSDISGNKYMLVEIAGSSPSDLEELVTKQGKFEAKIGNETVFTGESEDITYVGKTGKDAGVYECYTISSGEACKFMFTITLSPTAIERYANVTKNIPINKSNPEYLEKTIDFYVDGVLLESLLISKDLKGSYEPKHSLQGSGLGKDRKEAIDSAKLEMKKLQTILITGSLPFKLKIIKIDRISPRLGDDFTRHILLAGVAAFIAVALVIFIRYKNFKISVINLVILFSELILTLGIAALIRWNLDLPSLAGIVAAIGTGVDDQVVILDEASTKTDETLKQRIKNALKIVMSSYITAAASLLPLTGALTIIGIGAVSAGLLKGFAITTLIGISVGVFITRPAFADITRQIKND
ncbi:MAG: hypothetical protein ACOYT4_01465 [Nanoarchaeota archaeon]